MRVLVCGGRKFYNKLLLKRTLDALHDERGITCIIHGGATGADFLAKQWAIAYGGMPEEEYKYERGGTGKSAGSIRNLMMLVQGKPDLVVAFPGNNGTADMKRQARKHGVLVMEVPDDSNS